MSHLLENLNVIDAATFLAGPGSATILGDFGANVIKIEPPGGDGYRALVGRYPVPYHWQLTSRNKKSLCLDLSKPEGREVMHTLIAQADVLTTNFLPKVLAKYEMEYERLKAINPRLIFAHISGYGLKGPEVERRAFDVTAWWGRSGLGELIRAKGGEPQRAGPGMGDHSTALSLFGAIMTGLYRRELTGEGAFVSTSLLANGLWGNGMALQGVIAGNDLSSYKQNKGWHDPFTDIYECADGQFIQLACINAMKEWPKICAALDCEHLMDDERFTSYGSMMKHRMALLDLLQLEFRKHDVKSVCERMDAEDVTYGRMVPMSEVVHDEQALANDFIVKTEDPGEDYAYTINSPVFVEEAPKKTPRRAPDVGADTVSVLAEFGFDSARINQLIDAGAVVDGTQVGD